MGQRRKITFLIGAHKTATTHLQRSLADCAGELAKHDIAAIGPMPLGGDLIPFAELSSGRASLDLLQKHADNFLQKYCGDASTCILMNENIMGQLRPKPLFRHNKIYAPAAARLGRLVSLFPDHDVEIGLAIRHPANFIVSAWGEDMKGGPYYPFDTYFQGVKLQKLSWANMVQDMQAATNGLPMIIWRYEDYPAVAAPLLKHLMGDNAQKVVLRDSRVNSGLSAAAVTQLARTGDASGDAFKTAQSENPKSDKNPAFDPWSDEQKSMFDARYADDWARIRALPGIQTL